MWSAEAEAAIEAAQKAGAVALAGFRKQHAVRWKGARDIVTEVDVAAEKAVIEVLERRFPDDSILSEEEGWIRKGRERLWLVDPLDGTTNYTIHNPFFAVSVAFAVRAGKGYEVRSGAVLAPDSGELFIAEKGRGAFLNGARIAVSGSASLPRGLVTYCHGHSPAEIARLVRIFDAVKPRTKDFTRMRAGTLELAFVACGRTLAHVSNGGKAWDAAAGQLLVREAGGKVTDFAGSEWVLEPERAEQDIFASNGKVHAELLKLLEGL